MIDLDTLPNPGTSDFSLSVEVYDEESDEFKPFLTDFRLSAKDFPYSLRGLVPGYYRYTLNAILPMGPVTISSEVVNLVRGEANTLYGKVPIVFLPFLYSNHL